ncbi:AAA family ATPase [Candidatus Peregrinibacteria bacterium]|nr:AAA family ATPase [Candidatus Peregrinibacteria bacterium]
MSPAKTIIGLTGSIGAGKGEVVKILEQLGFQYMTLSQMVREEARRRGIPEEREKLQDLGNTLRAENGLGVFGKKAIEKLKTAEGSLWMVDGIRHPAEIDELRKEKGVHILGVTADRELLIERVLKRGRPSDPKTREEVVKRIDRDWGVGEKADGQQVGACVAKADTLIENNGTPEELNQKVLAYYNGIKPTM